MKLVMKRRKYCGNRPEKLRFMILDFFVDTILTIIGYKKNNDEVIPQKILLFNYGHLGDMLMMGYMVNALRIKHPSIEIHLVAGRWCKVLLENNPLYNKVFNLDHFQNNRQSISFIKKYFIYVKDIFSLIKSLKNEKYSHSFDFRYSAYNANQILPFLNIQQKCGFGTRGLGGLLDKEYFLLQNGTHTIEVQIQGLKNIGVDVCSHNIQPIILNNFDVTESLKYESKFLMVFPETGNPERMLSIDFWGKIIDLVFLKNPDIQLVICGVTNFNNQLSEILKKKHSDKIIEATNTLSIPQIINLLRKSEGSITLDSFPAHLSSSQTKTLCLFKNGSGNEYFPINSFPVHIIHDHKFSKNVLSFRDKMTVNYVENFHSVIFENQLKKSIIELFE